MQSLNVTLVQANQEWEDKIANLTKYDALLKDVNTDLIVLPEMFQTGFSMNVESLSEDLNNSSSLQWLKNKAQKLDAAIYTSLIAREDEAFYNRGVFVFPNGDVDYYDKRKTFTLAGEHNHFHSGEKKVIVNYKGWRIMLQICYDLRFPEICRNGIDSEGKPQYDALVYVANWPEKRVAHWNALLKARAIENQCYVLGVNRVGVDGTGLNYNGCTQVVNALGDVYFAEINQETVFNYELNGKHVKNCRS